MNLICLFGHKWNGCKCVRCGEIRDEQHDWDLCKGKCKRCGKWRDEQHNWDGCKCKGCGKVRDEQHSFEKATTCLNQCVICGKEQPSGHNWQNGKCVECGEMQSSLICKKDVWKSDIDDIGSTDMLMLLQSDNEEVAFRAAYFLEDKTLLEQAMSITNFYSVRIVIYAKLIECKFYYIRYNIYDKGDTIHFCSDINYDIRISKGELHNVKNKELLAEIAMKDPDCDVRKKAIEGVDDQTVLMNFVLDADAPMYGRLMTFSRVKTPNQEQLIQLIFNTPFHTNLSSSERSPYNIMGEKRHYLSLLREAIDELIDTEIKEIAKSLRTELESKFDFDEERMWNQARSNVLEEMEIKKLFPEGTPLIFRKQ